MTAQHTPGRLIAGTIEMLAPNVSGNHHCIGIEGTNTATALTGLVGDDVDALSAADARRLAACWNACEGLDTGALERIGDNFIKPMADLTAQRDQARADSRAIEANYEAARGLLSQFIHECNDGAMSPEQQSSMDLTERIRAFLKGGA